MTTLQTLDFCISILNEIEKDTISMWASVFVELKMDFFRTHQRPYIFTTRFGADFFTEVKEWILSDKYLVPENGIPLGEYDKNFNTWLKQVRMEK